MSRARRKTAIFATRLLTPRTYDLSDTIVVCGDGRSGTTWLAQSIATIPGSAVLFEPLHPIQVPQVTEAGFTWRTYIRPGTEWPAGRRLLERAFGGRILNEWTASLIEGPTRVTTWIVKCIRANRLLPWMSTWMQPRARVLILRHPCAVVSSQIESGWDLADASISPTLLEDYPDIRRVMRSCVLPEERRALDWAINTLVALSSGSTWITVCYEELLRDKGAVESIFRRWSRPVPAALEERLGAWSYTSRKRDGRPDVSTTLTEWHTRLDAEQVKRILGVTHALGLDFYGEDPQPDIGRLARRKGRADKR